LRISDGQIISFIVCVYEVFVTSKLLVGNLAVDYWSGVLVVDWSSVSRPLALINGQVILIITLLSQIAPKILIYKKFCHNLKHCSEL